MNDLVTVRKRVFFRNKKYNIGFCEIHRNIKMYLNELLKKETYRLTTHNKNLVYVEKFVDSKIGFFGYIFRSRNKKLFDKLYLTVRLLNE